MPRKRRPAARLTLPLAVIAASAPAPTLSHYRLLVASRRARTWRLLGAVMLFAALLVPPWCAARAQGARNEMVELTSLAAARSDEGIDLSFALRLNLPRHMEEALAKGVPLHFVAEAGVMRYRWYWSDRPVLRASRTWRLAWQPLARNWRVSFGGLQQHYATLPEALAVITRSTHWKIAEAQALDDGGRYSVDFSWRLDATQLPRPLQFGLGNNEWDLSVERSIPLTEAGH